MTMLRRRAAAAVLALTAAAGSLLVAGTAHAQPATTASLSFSGDSGDYISQGKSWSYDTSNGDVLNVTGSTSGIHVSVTGYNGDWWTLDIDAPDQAIPAQPASLAPGTYTNAHRYPFNGTGPGLDLSGEGRGCNELTGSYTITNAVFGPDGYVQTFDATFEQHCEGGTPAARGEVHVSNPAPQPPPPPAPPPTTGEAHTSNPAPPPGDAPASTTATQDTTASTQPTSTSTPSRTTDVISSSESIPRVPLLLVGLSLVGWAVFLTVGFVAVGLVMALRRR